MRRPEDLPAPAAFSALKRFRRGAMLIEAGDAAEYVYLVRRGQVRTFMLAESGHETTTAVLGPGQLVGISALLGQPTHHAFAEALSEVEAWVVPADRLVEQLPRDPNLLGIVLKGLARRLALSQALLRDVVLLPVPERIADVRRRLETFLGGDVPRLRREDLAALVGARPETISRATARTRRGRARAPDGGSV